MKLLQLLLPAIFSISVCYAGYRPSTLPEIWKFQAETPAFLPENPDKKIGDFKKGITVYIIEEQRESGHWLVEYRKNKNKPYKALIKIPNLSKALPAGYKKAAAIINGFPVLKKQLNAEQAWPEDIAPLTKRLFEKISNTYLESGTDDKPIILRTQNAETHGNVWKLKPRFMECDYSVKNSPRINIEFWNKADLGRTLTNPFKTKKVISKNLSLIEDAFRYDKKSTSKSNTQSSPRALKKNEEIFLLPNNLKALLRYKRDEYLILELKPQYNPYSEANISSDTSNQDFQSNVKVNEDGYRYVDGIPMISQGKKGYCVAATLARVLVYYGYDVDMHELADLADTKWSGTKQEDTFRAMKRVCNGTPFKLENIDRYQLLMLQNHLDEGFPIIWRVPGHLRLIIGYHPDSSDIVYSDSWGAGHEFKTMNINEYYNVSRDTFVLKAKD